MPLLQHFVVSAAGYKQVLQQMQSALDALEPDTLGHIVEQFLVGEVELGLTECKWHLLTLKHDISLSWSIKLLLIPY
ncbi:T7SS effector LXG polymorphic toxin [Psychrobacillus lasiicapitis]|uniref:T7SS effector LXG polymorphic toxin n=1 Tax=Psychrobacillus lasiicapitis TaxID=1636719 RepID=UPI003570AF13